MSSSAQSRKAIKMISRREGIWDKDGDGDEEEEDEVMADQLLRGSLLVRDGGVVAYTELCHSEEEERPTAAHLLSRGRPANKDTPKPKTTLIINFPNSAVHVI